MTLEKELREIVKNEILSLFNEDEVKYGDQISSIEKMVMQIKDAYAAGNEKKAMQLTGIIMPQIMSMGFDKPHLSKIQQQLKNMTTDKDAYLLLTTYKLIEDGDDKAGTDDIYKYKVIVSIPFSTAKNKDEKVSQLKYFLVTSGVKILGIKELPVAEIAKVGDDPVIQLHILLMVKTYQKRSEFENSLQPDYKLIKIKDVSNGNK